MLAVKHNKCITQSIIIFPVILFHVADVSHDELYQNFQHFLSGLIHLWQKFSHL